MPANLPPEYYEAEKGFKEATSPGQKVAALEALIATVPKHKGTDKLRADLRRRLSRLRDEAVRRKKGGKGASLYTVPREGASQVVLTGFANSGKSSLLAALTNAKPVVADYPMSTVMPLPGMMPYEDIQLQLVDLPPLGNESTDGWVSSILRTADVLLVVIDLAEDPEVQAELLMEQLAGWNIPPGRGEGRKKAVVAANKNDAPGAQGAVEGLKERFEGLCPVIGVSATGRQGLEELKEALFEAAEIIRVYTKEPGKEPDMAAPFTLPSGSTVSGLARAVHKDFSAGMKYACIWGSAKFPGQKVPRDYQLRDRDIVELHI
jgi:ribosome-interacting GTPase 1